MTLRVPQLSDWITAVINSSAVLRLGVGCVLGVREERGEERILYVSGF